MRRLCLFVFENSVVAFDGECCIISDVILVVVASVVVVVVVDDVETTTAVPKLHLDISDDNSFDFIDVIFPNCFF